MDFVFFLKLFLSFIVGGLWIIFATTMADKFGTKIGGLIAGLPSTVLFSLLFIVITQSSQKAVETTTIIPAIGGVDVLFMVAYIYFTKKHPLHALAFSCLLWTIFAFLLVMSHFDNYYLSLAIYLFLFLASFIFVEKILHVPAVSGKKVVYTSSNIVFRGLVSGGTIALSVLFAKLFGANLGGIFAMFPAATASMILITAKEHGSAFSAAMTKSVLYSMTSTIVYALLVRYTYPLVGFYWGTCFSLVGSSLTALLLYQFIIKRAK
jgi:uncharacterized membrane protein (GlpM family)